MSPCCFESEDAESKGNRSRGCTDVLCLAIFGIFWGLLIFIAAFAIVIGNPTRLAYGQDSFGNTCGMKNEELGNMTFSGMDMTDRPYLFFLNMTNLYHSLKICVKKCPDKTLWDDNDIQNFESETGSHLCRYDIVKFMGRSALYPAVRNETVDKYFLHVEEKNGHYACPKPPVIATKSLFKRCVPLPVANFAGDIIYSVYAYLNSFDTIQQVVSDIYAVKIEILEMVALAIVISVIVVILIHRLASLVSWIIMLVACIACIGGTCVLWWTYADIKWQLDSTPFNQLLSESVHNEQTFLVYAILATIFTVILLLIVIVMRKRVNIVVLLFVESAQCIKSMPFLLIQPIFTFLALACFISFWIFVLVALATAYYPIKNRVENPLQLTSPAPLPESYTESFDAAPLLEEEKLLNKAFTLVSFNQSSWVQYMWWYHLIALIWTSEFILGCQQMVIAGSVATWYFTRDRNNLSKPILKSITNLTIYHLGSVALGSFLITLFKIPRIILTYMISYMKKHQEWKCIAWCLKCCICCLWCMEKCIRYLNHNAYTIVAIQGVGFCTAAREAFDILVSNALQVATINSVAHCILSIYEMVIDTLFLCCCEDLLRNDGSKEKPYFGGKLVRYIKGGDGHSLQPLNKVGGDTSETE
ncbi:CTL-like protein 1 [Nephila pilipes]|uniref:Choline transporter-like protein n=1 Tax=Nephila pilipes TaxID=299642 RepID=A0A8X6QHT2_NEPPI|nr:CTL-like protein 1 [Nephila pilipes]